MKPLLIALVGHPGAGKNAIGDILAGGTGLIHPNGGGTASIMHPPESGPWELLGFANPLKEAVRDVYGFSFEQLYGPSANRDIPDPRYVKDDGTCMTPREPLKAFGLAARECYPRTWSEKALREADEARGRGLNVAFTDCRFINEAKPVVERGGQVWRIYRREVDEKTYDHQSELEMDTPEFEALVTHRIYNNSTLEDLAFVVRNWIENPNPGEKR